MFARLFMFSFIVFFAHNALANDKAWYPKNSMEPAPHTSRPQ